MAYTIEGSVIPEHRREPAHYYGSIVRVLFAVGAVILFIAATTVPLPLPLFGTVINAIILIIAAGITNPEQAWIQWGNAALAVFETLRGTLLDHSLRK